MGKRDPNVEAKWRQLISSCAQSGQTAKAFCQEHGLAQSTFQYWRRRLRQLDGVVTGVEQRRATKQSKPTKHRFVQVAMTAATSSIQIHVADELVISVPTTLDRPTLTDIIAAARMARSC